MQIILEDVESDSLSPAVSLHLSKFVQTLGENRSGNGTVVVITSNVGGQAINKMLLDASNPPVTDSSELLSFRERVTVNTLLARKF